MKRFLFALFLIFLLLYLLCFPQYALTASANGINLWFHSVLPSLLPFLIITGLLIRSNLFSVFTTRIPQCVGKLFGLSSNGVYIFLLGLFCGYPMGAKLTADFYRNQKITLNEASYLLLCSNHPGPMFISGYLVHQTLNDSANLTKYYICLYLSTFLCMIIYRTIYRRWNVKYQNSPMNKKEVSSIPFAEFVDTSIMNAFETITKLGGYIILFSLISSMSETILPENIFCYLFQSLIEITTGAAVIAKLSWSISWKAAVILGMCSFGGISCIYQTISMIEHTPLSIRAYCTAKILNGFLTFLLVLFVF